MLERLEEKKRKLQDDYENYDINSGMVLLIIDANVDNSKPSNTRKAARLAVKAEERKERKNKKQVVPTLVFALNDADVYDDMALIRIVIFLLTRICRFLKGPKLEVEYSNK
jgi:hypothetical protein